MFPKGAYLGCPYSLEDLRVLNDRLNNKVVDQVNDSQALGLLNSFAHEANEYQFRKCLQERIAVISSWHWVLDDLAKRLNDAIENLKYEQNAIDVVITRIQDELETLSINASKPGALCPMTDCVEEAILQENKFLRNEKKKFEQLAVDLNRHIVSLLKTKKRIEDDIMDKKRALSIEESCAKLSSVECVPSYCRRKKGPLIGCWENRCISLKQAGLRALSRCIVIRQQVRGARTHLSIAAQTYSARVDSVLRRRLHTNRIKMQDLKWQKDEALRDYKILAEELTEVEKNIIVNIDQERLVLGRLADRSLRPPGEMTRDDVNKKLKEELASLRNFCKQMRVDHERITALQSNLTESMYRTDVCADEIMQVILLDAERIRGRTGEDLCGCPVTSTTSNVSQPAPMPCSVSQTTPIPSNVSQPAPVCRSASPCRSEVCSLPVIGEENEDEEEDDYPLPY